MKQALHLLALLTLPIAPAVAAVPPPADTVKTQQLNEATVKAYKLSHQADRDIYTITARDVRRYVDAIQLVGLFPGVHYNMADESLTVNSNSNIAFQVNGVDKSREQVKAYPPAAIKRVEIIHTPAGKYTGQGISYIINYIIREEYRGFGANLQNFLILSPNGHNGNNVIANEQPQIGVQYLYGKWNINAGYTYGNIHWNYPLSYEKRLADGTTLVTTTPSPHHPNQLDAQKAHSGRFGVDFMPGKNHTLSFNTSYSYEKNSSVTDYAVNKTLPGANEAKSLDEHTGNAAYSNDLRTSLSYNGRLSAVWRLEASVNYNRLWSDQTYDYRWGSSATEHSSYASVKDYVGQYLSAAYKPSAKWDFDFGLSNIYNQYGTRDRLVPDATDIWQRSYRGRLYAYASHKASKALTLRGGLAVNYVTQEGDNRFLVQPSFSFNYQPKGIFALRLNYSMKPSYPKQYQLTSAIYALDSVITQQGNPALRSLSYENEATLVATLWNQLTLTSYFNYNPHSVEQIYRQADDRSTIISTFTNARLLQSVSSLDYTWNITNSWIWSNTVQANYYKVKQQGRAARDVFRWFLTSELTYYNMKSNTAIQLGYYRNMARAPRLQGFYETGRDMYLISLQQMLFKNRMSVQLMYQPPIHTGLRQSQRSLVETPFYRFADRLNLSTYDNLIMLRLRWYFHKGKRTKEVNDKTTYDDESPKGRELM